MNQETVSCTRFTCALMLQVRNWSSALCIQGASVLQGWSSLHSDKWYSTNFVVLNSEYSAVTLWTLLCLSTRNLSVIICNLEIMNSSLSSPYPVSSSLFLSNIKPGHTITQATVYRQAGRSAVISAHVPHPPTLKQTWKNNNSSSQKLLISFTGSEVF